MPPSESIVIEAPMNERDIDAKVQTLHGDWQAVGTIDAIPRLGARVVETDEGNIAVFRTATDEVYAIEDRCPHRGGPLSPGIVAGSTVTCPLHGWNIDLASGSAVAPDEGVVGTYPVRVIDGRVYLSLTRVEGAMPCAAACGAE